ncbi:MAG TPA: DUF1844 domain-containing protein [Ignavibacteria bacterium]|nr:DUF1844 domain-containing protein [Ignavibacteria bacterium]
MNDEKNKQLFFQLVYSFQMQTMMMMGKLANPMTGKIEKELDGAQATIDMLDMLSAKTVNNITEDEARFLKQVIADLKLNFVEEKDKALPEEKAEIKEESEVEVPENTSNDAAADKSEDTKV